MGALCCVPGKGNTVRAKSINGRSFVSNPASGRSFVSNPASSFVSNPSLIIERKRTSTSEGIVLSESPYFDVIERYENQIILRHGESGKILSLTRYEKAAIVGFRSKFCERIRLMSTVLPIHSCFINLYGSWQAGQFIYLLEDGNCAERLLVSDLAGLREAAVDLAIALHIIHSHGLVHGNVNPFIIYPSTGSGFGPFSLRLGGFGHLRSVCGGGERLSGQTGDFVEFSSDKVEYYEEIDWISYAKTLGYWKSECGESKEVLDDLIGGLLDEVRYGYGPGTFKRIQLHEFFSEIDWESRYPVALRASKTSTNNNNFSTSIESLKNLNYFDIDRVESERSGDHDDNEDDWSEFINFTCKDEMMVTMMLESIIKGQGI